MKRLLLTLSALILAASVMAAQDMAQATETYNNGASALSEGNKTAAIEYFQSALKDALQCGEEGAELVSKCKEVIPSLHLSIAKDLIKASDYDKAVAKLQEAAKVAAEYEAAEDAAEAATLIPQVLLQKGNSLLTAKDYAGAAEAYKTILAADAKNGMAALRLGMALNAAGDTDGAIEALKNAMANGQEANAKKQLSTVLLKEASKFLSAKDYQKAMDVAPSANAFKIAGTAATNLTKKAEAVQYLSKYLELSPDAKDAAQIKAAIEALKK